MQNTKPQLDTKITEATQICAVFDINQGTFKIPYGTCNTHAV